VENAAVINLARPFGGPFLNVVGDCDADLHDWFALHVRSRHEKVVEESLNGKGYAVLAPSYRLRRQRADRVVDIDVPVFPGYVFCRFDPFKRLPVMQTPGIVSIIGAGRQPEPIADTEIASIQAMVSCGRRLQPWPFLREGQKVRICAGSLAGAEGTLVRIKNETRLIASVTLLQRAVSVELDQDVVEPMYN